MTDLELAAATKAVRRLAPLGMGDFLIREIAMAALAAAERFRPGPRHVPDAALDGDGCDER